MSKNNDHPVVCFGETLWDLPPSGKQAGGHNWCGDAFLAALISKMTENASIEKTLHFVNHLAAFVATQKGACPEYEVANIPTSFNNYDTSTKIKHFA